MGNPPPLSVDPEQLAAAGGELLASAADLPAAPAPFMPVGTDPLSLAIIAQIPEIELPVATQLPKVQAESTATANNVLGAAQAYASTDEQLGGQIGKEMQNLPNVPGVGSGGPASAASSASGSLGQMMGMPMQVAGQMAQMPMQVVGAAAAVPQGVMQGAQQVGQQVSQMTGQFGQSGASGQGGSTGGKTGIPGGEVPEAERVAKEQKAEFPNEERGDEREKQEGAAVGHPGAERVPEANKIDSPPTPPGRHRLPDRPVSADDGMNL